MSRLASTANASRPLCSWYSTEQAKAQDAPVEEPAAGKPGESTEEQPIVDEVTEEVDDAMALRLKQAEERIGVLEDQLRRAIAERENIRKIAHNDMETTKKFAIRNLAKDILDVVDDLERALGSVKPEDLETNKELKNLNQGVTITHSGIISILKRNHITPIPAEGKFDPAVHSALFSIPDATKEPDTIGQVVKNGYLLHDRVLRAAEVGVFIKA